MPMAEADEMSQRGFGGGAVIEDDVGDAGDVLVAGDADHRQRKILIVRSVHGDQAFDTALVEEFGIAIN